VAAAEKAPVNRIVREHYPVGKLPEDLRGDLDLSANVTITLVQEHARDHVVSLGEIFAVADRSWLSKDEIDSHLASTRDVVGGFDLGPSLR
jgi:hypothetical protein